MDLPQQRRKKVPKYIDAFPYVNGGLFTEQTEVPTFSKRAKNYLIDAAELNWREITPDIFGSMIQAVVHEDMRGDLGMHYTSVPNIMKVLHPLFLMALEEDFAEANGHRQERSLLKKLLTRISHIRVFDPACGSGNFLIVAYCELRKIEMRIFQRQDELEGGQAAHRFESGIRLSNFYGIELADFADAKRSVAKTDETSSRSACEDFEQFKPLFDQCAVALKTGSLITRRFTNEQEIALGDFFIVNGLMAYVAEVGKAHTRNGKKNARLRVIFDNGTEGKNLLRSLATELYKDPNGRRVITASAGPLFETRIEASDTRTGMIYVVKSLSDNPEITKHYDLLHKIGFTAGTLEARTRGAADSTAFLMAPVQPVATYELYGINKVQLEYLLHQIFATVRLNIEITDRFGAKVKPREWFLVPADVIAEAIGRLRDGSITRYRFDADKGRLVQIC